MRVAVSWSGGKDAALAMERAREEGHEVVALLNLVDNTTGRVRAHELRDVAVQAQAGAMGVALAQKDASWDQYEAHFKEVARRLRNRENVEGIVFGDIHLEEHREWGERVCSDLEVEPLYPLWSGDAPSGSEGGAAETDEGGRGGAERKVVEELLDRGFEATVVSVRDPLGEEVLGRELDRELLSELVERGDVGPAGEDGAYHTFVHHGPGWADEVRFTLGDRFDADAYRCVEVELEEPGKQRAER